MKSDKLRAARHLADQAVKKWLKSEVGRSRSAEEIAIWWVYGFEWFEGPRGSYIVAPKDIERMMFDRAATDPHARAVMLDKVWSKLVIGQSLTEAESIFAALALVNRLPAIARKRGKPRDALFERNFFIIGLANELIEYFHGSMKATRNDEKCGPHESAADLISEAFAANGRHEVTYRAVKDVLTDRRLKRICRTIWKHIDRLIDEQKTRGINALADFRLMKE